MPPEPVAVSGRPVRPHTTQVGVDKVVAPRAINSVTRRPTTGGAPWANASGSDFSAAARLRHTAWLVATASTAAETSCVDSDVPAAATLPMISCPVKMSASDPPMM